ncbi:MAG: hypothetical protein LBT30_01515 [Clostridiales bacterium]|nr:hypothetical protein [Clostridiales bacterium]
MKKRYLGLTLIFLCVLSFSLVGCDSKNELVGIWKCPDEGSSDYSIIEFKKDKTAIYNRYNLHTDELLLTSPNLIWYYDSKVDSYKMYNKIGDPTGK